MMPDFRPLSRAGGGNRFARRDSLLVLIPAMIWARIDTEFSGFAWKRLTSHEIDPEVSHGHEFQGINGLVELLGEQDRKDIPTDYYLIVDDDEGGPVVAEVVHATASWYDSRRNNPNRSAEWRLYYPAAAELIEIRCGVGDLMIIGLRNDQTLAAMLMTGDSSSEIAVRNALGIGHVPPRGRGKVRWIESTCEDVGLNAAETMELLNASFEASAVPGSKAPLPVPTMDFSSDNFIGPIVDELLGRWPDKLGSCNEVVNLIIKHAGFTSAIAKEEPDRVLQRWLELAEASYRIWEKDVFERFLGPLRWDKKVGDLQLAERVSEKWMSFRQSRVSRAGLVMECFLDSIFAAWNLRYDWGPRMSDGRRPDFLFPGKDEYENEEFPPQNLRLLGAKTSMKERWRQILAEGDRVASKHGITRDDAITPATFEQMQSMGFTVVMPESVVSSYKHVPSNLVTLHSFLKEVRRLQAT